MSILDLIPKDPNWIQPPNPNAKKADKNNRRRRLRRFFFATALYESYKK